MKPTFYFFTVLWACLCPLMKAVPVPVVNPGFEDTTGQTVFNEFTFGPPIAGWDIYDPNGIVAQPDIYVGTLSITPGVFFTDPAPEGSLAGILFNSGREGDGEYGFFQELVATLQANAEYILTAEVGNIASGTAVNNQFFNLDEFPGYRVELMVETDTPDEFIVLGEPDDNSLTIPEGEFSTSTVTVFVNPDHPYLGNNIGIRLVNLNVIPEGYTQQTSPDLEVDFDDVILTAATQLQAESSSLSITGPAGEGDPSIVFDTTPGMTYSIRAADSPDATFMEIGTVAGTGNQESFTDTRLLTDRQFYQIFEE